uniref:DUF5641 domain-containing protein n=1 Tax=Phlebotomus papatasi TaxID=29031 RepID=A0A1B0DG74_PHLPP
MVKKSRGELPSFGPPSIRSSMPAGKSQAARKGNLTQIEKEVRDFHERIDVLEGEDDLIQLHILRDKLQQLTSKYRAEQHGLISSQEDSKSKLEEQEELRVFNERVEIVEKQLTKIISTVSVRTQLNSTPQGGYVNTSGNLDASAILALLKTTLEQQERQRSADNEKFNLLAKKILEAEPSSSIVVEPVKVPEFDGNYRQWKQFHSVFTALVHNDETISPAQKLSHLKSKLKGVAADTISHLEITNENYAAAWATVKKQFDNKPSIIAAHMDCFMNQQPLKAATAAGVKKLQMTSSSTLQSLSALGVPQSDPWMIHIVCNKLDSETRSLWFRESAGQQSSWDFFEEFLIKRDSLDNLSVDCLVLKKVTSNQPNWSISHSDIQIPEHLHLADPHWYKNSPIDMLIGAQHFWDILKSGVVELGNDLPSLRETLFGWVIVGAVPPPSPSLDKVPSSLSLEKVTCQVASHATLDFDLSRFFEIEDVPADKPGNSDHLAVESLFLTTTKRSPEGRYISRVTPVKANSDNPRPLTIPKAELCGAVLATKLVEVVSSAIQISAIYFWCDAEVVIHQIHNSEKKRDVFTRNRVQEILKRSDPVNWRHIPGTENPADILSRGASPDALIANRLWWHGPPWLQESCENWPLAYCRSKGGGANDSPQVTLTLTSKCEFPSIFEQLLSRYSDFDKMKRILAKWDSENENLKVSDIVLIKDDLLPSTHWSLGRIERVFPQQNDEKVRVVEVRTSKGLFKRPVV